MGRVYAGAAVNEPKVIIGQIFIYNDAAFAATPEVENITNRPTELAHGLNISAYSASSDNGGDQTAQLTVLGTGRLPQPEGGPSVSLLEVFPNRFPHRPYVVSMAFPEYTSLCPVTGQPDFGTIVVEFIPDQKCVESKSFKLYMFAYRNHQSFMESITNTILEDFVEALDPMWCRVKGLFSPRGATYLHVFAEHYKKLDDPAKAEEVRQAVADWKREAAPHTWDK